MTLVKVLITQHNAQGIKSGAIGQLTFTPNSSQIIAGDPDNLVLPIPFSVKLVNGAADIQIAPSTAEWVWKVETFIQGSAPIPAKYVTIPSVSSIDFTDLVQVDPATFAPLPVQPEPLWYAYVDGLELTAQDAAQTATDMAATMIPVKTSIEASQAAALVSETNAYISATSASVSAQSAATSKALAETAAAGALSSEQASAASKSAAAGSASSATSSASTATTKASEASASASSAQSSATSATSSATTATTQAGIATQKASDAGTSAFNAGQSASSAWGHSNDAEDSASAALSSQTIASTKASEAATSATSSASNATASQTARVGAEAAQTITVAAKDATVLAANGFTLGTVTTVPGELASATITGVAPDRKLNLEVPVSQFSIGTIQTGAAGTSAEATLTGTYPTQALNLTIPLGDATQLTIDTTTTGPDVSGQKGDKGDPGGIVLGISLGTADLNDILSPGVYRQINSSGADSQLVKNYPYNGGYGVLVVHQTTPYGDLIQTFYPQSYSPILDARVTYQRNRSNNTWSVWRSMNSTRIDQTAGRAIYQWDNLNNREQLIYGDTGWRSVPFETAVNDVLDNTNTNYIHVRRVGSTVHFRMGVRITTPVHWATFWTPLVGFKSPTNGFPTHAQPIVIAHSGTSAVASAAEMLHMVPWHNAVRYSGGMNASAFVITKPGMTCAASWDTSDPWPTTLPGTAIGSIPNL